ncbi:MAG: P-loop NTPase [Desulfobacterales bacterium]|nr:P-loop NTPase [Desulfobacterales bacterium]
MEVFGLIENMSGFTCPHCQAVLDLFGTGGGERTASDMNVPFLGRIPFDAQMVECSDAGVSYQQKHPESAVSKAYAGIAEKILAS